jgi:undecaprenyl diphosphate synthase
MKTLPHPPAAAVRAKPAHRMADLRVLAPPARHRLPRHVGLIPDGNRRWAAGRGLAREEGYASGLAPGLELFEHCRRLDLDEVSVYGFTQDNTRRPTVQTERFREACVAFALQIASQGAALRVIGDAGSAQFPAALHRFSERQGDGLKVNFLVNYGWQWDLDGLRDEGRLRSHDVSRIDLIVRWGGACRLSGFLPVQSVYADFHVIDDFWPDFRIGQFERALAWYARQDRTLGG